MVISVIPYDDPEDEVRVEYKTVIVRLSCSYDLTSFPDHHLASRCLQYGFHVSDVTGRKTIEKLQLNVGEHNYNVAVCLHCLGLVSSPLSHEE